MTQSDNPTESQRYDQAVETFTCHAARLMTDSHCENVVVLDLRGVSQIADYFVVATGTSDRQLLSVADELKMLGREEGQNLFRLSGDDNPQWVVLDFVDVVMHLFVPHMREYYDLESLWGDAKQVDWQSRTKPGQFAKLSARKKQMKDLF